VNVGYGVGSIYVGAADCLAVCIWADLPSTVLSDPARVYMNLDYVHVQIPQIQCPADQVRTWNNHDFTRDRLVFEAAYIDLM
jgi:hypothetical protein